MSENRNGIEAAQSENLPPPPLPAMPVRRAISWRRRLLVVFLILCCLPLLLFGLRLAVKAYMNSGPTADELTAAFKRDDADTLREALRRHPNIAHDKSEYAGTALYVAVLKDKPRFADALLDYGADMHEGMSDGLTSLELALVLDRVKIITVFLDHGLKVDEPFGEKQYPLSSAAANGSYKVVEFLITRGANVNRKDPDDGQSVITSTVFWHIFNSERLPVPTDPQQKASFEAMTQSDEAVYASEEDYAKVITTLLRHGADPHVVDEEGMTPLHVAAEHNCPLLAVALIEGGADVNRKDASGKRPLTLARSAGHHELATKLRAYGAYE